MGTRVNADRRTFLLSGGDRAADQLLRSRMNPCQIRSFRHEHPLFDQRLLKDCVSADALDGQLISSHTGPIPVTTCQGIAYARNAATRSWNERTGDVYNAHVRVRTVNGYQGLE